jgi:hypothetical protein
MFEPPTSHLSNFPNPDQPFSNPRSTAPAAPQPTSDPPGHPPSQPVTHRPTQALRWYLLRGTARPSCDCVLASRRKFWRGVGGEGCVGSGGGEWVGGVGGRRMGRRRRRRGRPPKGTPSEEATRWCCGRVTQARYAVHPRAEPVSQAPKAALRWVGLAPLQGAARGYKGLQGAEAPTFISPVVLDCPDHVALRLFPDPLGPPTSSPVLQPKCLQPPPDQLGTHGAS